MYTILRVRVMVRANPNPLVRPRPFYTKGHSLVGGIGYSGVLHRYLKPYTVVLLETFHK